ncbi:MAG: hypothetical protein L3J54_10345 [Draconibacterium sp.]|nr:hypothetical protein [Draconibacterium sp.]
MNIKKKIIQYILILFLLVILFLFLPVIFDWSKAGTFNPTSKDIWEAVFLGVFTPSVIILSRKVKSNILFVLLILFIASGVLMAAKLLFNW